MVLWSPTSRFEGSACRRWVATQPALEASRSLGDTTRSHRRRQRCFSAGARAHAGPRAMAKAKVWLIGIGTITAHVPRGGPMQGCKIMVARSAASRTLDFTPKQLR